ncbi:uncharacterized protein TRIADDRAFT_59588 [Trichoplax adhaerens]|uniref:FZ domain-containing protein n=1 Tax=Trichoplax adhaerens TaxID=10228 RepID=B3S5E5_TRIAD|nr:predicted protein [Trichoplax adhaerens]EDV22023.1 predicted protein [Trichoplax adhaerens]|eukprot:XP_002115660.1 predicted protein [Trichoplax adhaerens]
MVPTIPYRRYTGFLESIRTSWPLLQSSLNSSCRNSLRNTICKGSLPRCSDDRTTIITPDYSSGCATSLTCGSAIPSLQLPEDFRKFFCSESSKEYSLNTCAKTSLTAINAPICGKLPSGIQFPAWIIPFLPTQGKNIDNFKQGLTMMNTTKECIDQWMEIVCNSLPYCSKDAKKVVTVTTTQSCQAAMKCLSPIARIVFESMYVCSGFPDRNGQKMMISSDYGYSYATANNGALKVNSNILIVGLLYLLSWI